MRLRPILLLAALLTFAGQDALHAQQNVLPAGNSESVRATEAEIAALFDRWNASLQTGDPAKVAANYAERSLLLPTLSGIPRFTKAEKEDYFHHFLEDGPSGTIDVRFIEIGSDHAVDSGHYTFTFARTGQVVRARYTFTYGRFGSDWLITSHHSSILP